MGKLLDYLTKQLNTEYKKDAEECLTLYNYLASRTISSGKDAGKPYGVWDSEWRMLVYTTFKGFPSDERRYKLSEHGKIYLKGLQN